MEFTIYQIKDIKNTDYAFRGYEDAEEKFSINDYKIVCEWDIKDEVIKDITNYADTLDYMYNYFNGNLTNLKPNLEGFEGRSMSVSDVIKLDDVYYYCDEWGWAPVEV